MGKPCDRRYCIPVWQAWMVRVTAGNRGNELKVRHQSNSYPLCFTAPSSSLSSYYYYSNDHISAAGLPYNNIIDTRGIKEGGTRTVAAAATTTTTVFEQHHSNGEGYSTIINKRRIKSMIPIPRYRVTLR